MTADRKKQEKLTRRNFLKMGIGALGAVALLEITGVSLLYMQPRSSEGAFGGVVEAGTVDSFPLGSVTEFPDGRFYLIRAENDGFLAVYHRCTHLGCTVNWQANENRFFCPCHASEFDIHGDVQNPPAPRPLDTFAVTIEEGIVYVDTSGPQKRDEFAAEQLVYA